jgi:hypothetical protein
MRLRLDGNDMCPKPSETSDAIAHMRASVEDQIAGPDKLMVEPIHRGAPVAVAVIDA